VCRQLQLTSWNSLASGGVREPVLPELIQAIIEPKQRNPRFGCPRIAQQINKAFGMDIDKDLARRVLAKHYRPMPDDNGPSWLTFVGHAKDSLWLMSDQGRFPKLSLSRPGRDGMSGMVARSGT